MASTQSPRAWGREVVDKRPLWTPELKPGRWPILQGATSATAVQLAIVCRKGEEPAVDLSGYAPAERHIESRPYSPWAVLKLRYQGLPESATLSLQVGGASGDRRQLRLRDHARTRSRIGIMSCVEDTGDLPTQSRYWKGFLDQRPDALLLIGDHVYVDQGTAIADEPWDQRIWRRYAESRLFHDLYYAPELLPIYATWDDHDFGRNNANATVEWKDAAAETFRAFFAQAAEPGVVQSGPGIASAVDLHGVRWILADDRTWRDLPGAAGPTHWGDAQDAWVDQMIDAASGTAMICNGSQFFGGYLPGESYEKSHAATFAAFRARLRMRRNRVGLISGDRHFSEFMRVSPEDVGYETFELTTSGFIQISHLALPWPFFKNPRRVAGTSEAYNYALMELSPTSGGQVQGTVASISNKGHTIFTRDFAV
jgi:hypothetical protein